MSEEGLHLLSVNDLRHEADGSARRFFVPAYQRGFRWSARQVTQLLDDIQEFVRRPSPQPEEFYCLQPLVVRRREGGEFEVVDGQQRLTTLLLILRHFNERLAEKYRQQIFELSYETRADLLDFFEAPDASKADDNVDFFHLHEAIRAIEGWFGPRDSEVEDVKSALLNKTKVIWFELAGDEDPVGAFTRLNVGKIPLTSDELIRALFLRTNRQEGSQETRQQVQIAQEWDLIEKALQRDAFWFFLSNEPQVREARIGFIFDLIAQRRGTTIDHDDPYATFYAFGEYLGTQAVKVEALWREVKQTYLLLEEWFEDRALYHMVGFLVTHGMGIPQIDKLADDCTKSEFNVRLRAEIYHRVVGDELTDDLNRTWVRNSISNRLAELDYRYHATTIRAVLLLFNVATLLQHERSNIRFQFESYKRQNWDIEHIRSVTDERPERDQSRIAWLRHCSRYLESADPDAAVGRKIDDFLKLESVQAREVHFDQVYESVLQHFHEHVGAGGDNGIGNLVLLDEQTNRSYKNAVFAVKRWRLLELDQAGVFVPVCTRNAFLKTYSPQVDNTLRWFEEDQQGYEQAIGRVLTDFFLGERG